MKTSLKVSVALALTAAFASTGALAEATKEFNVGGYARYDMDVNDGDLRDNYRVRLNFTGKSTNSRGQFVAGHGRIQMNESAAGSGVDSGNIESDQMYIAAGTKRLHGVVGHYSPMSIWDEKGEEKFVSEGDIGSLDTGFYTTDTGAIGGARDNVLVGVNYNPSNRTKAQVAVMHNDSIDATAIRPAITYDAGNYKLGAAALSVDGAGDADHQGLEVMASRKFGTADVSVMASQGKNDGTVAGDYEKATSLGLSAQIRNVAVGVVTSKNVVTDAAEDETVTAVYADYNRPFLVDGASLNLSAGYGKVKNEAGVDGAEDSTRHVGARIKYNF